MKIAVKGEVQMPMSLQIAENQIKILKSLLIKLPTATALVSMLDEAAIAEKSPGTD